MSVLIGPPPLAAVEPVTDVLHGVSVTDPYRWLEDRHSPETRAWIAEQAKYAGAYLDRIPGRERIRERVGELLDVETHDCFVKSGKRYFFRKRLPGQEQPCIYMRDGADGEDQLLIDPRTRGTGDYTAVKPLKASHHGSLLLYEVKQGGERTGVFEILDITNHCVLPDSLPHGYLRGFAFAPDGRGFYYVHEATSAQRPFYRAAFHHVLGDDFANDKEVFRAGEDHKIRLGLISGSRTLGYLVHRFLDKTRTDFHIWRMGSSSPPILILRDVEYLFAPRLVPGRILAVTSHNSPNLRIVEVQARKDPIPLYFDLVPEADALIRDWLITANHILVSYARGTDTEILVFDHFGKPVRDIPCVHNETIRIATGGLDDEEVILERESFVRPVQFIRYAVPSSSFSDWARRSAPIDASLYAEIQVSFPSQDGTSIPMVLVGRRDALSQGTHPVVMTSYGGFGKCATAQFSVLAAFLMERGCLLALPSVRGGSEFGSSWHEAAKRHKRQVTIDDFVAAAEWLVQTRRTTQAQLAIFGGSNSGLLVGAALTQRPDLFRAVLCLVPMLDMLRYHLFDNAHVWVNEFGVADNAEDFAALQRYSPYHAVRSGEAYPATMIVSGGADQNCNPLHARKMVARLQAANGANSVILLDYNELRGHSPVLPLATRIAALTDRLAFLCEQLNLRIETKE